MSSWWRQIAEDLGATGGTGSWARRVAEHLGADDEEGGWRERVVRHLDRVSGSGGWDKRLVPAGTSYTGSPLREALSSGAVGEAEESDPPAAPLNTAAPSISGIAKVGETLTGDDGTWDGSPTLARQWLADDVPISDATATTLVPAVAEESAEITLRVTGTNAGGSTQAFSSPTPPVSPADPAVPVSTAAPQISGSAVDGQTLTASTGTWTNGPTGYAYQWYGDGVALSGENDSTLQTDLYTGMEIEVGVVASNGDGPGDEAMSDPVGPVTLLTVGETVVESVSLVDSTITLSFTRATNATGDEYRAGYVNPPDGAWTELPEEGIPVLDFDGNSTVYFQVRGTRLSNDGPASNVVSLDTPYDPADEADVVDWWDFNDNTSVFSDSAGTTPAVADSTVVGRINGKKGASLQNSSSASCPDYMTIGGMRMAKFTRTVPDRLATGDAEVVAAANGDDNPYILIGAFKRGTPDVSATPAAFYQGNAASPFNRIRHFFSATDTVGLTRTVAGASVTVQSGSAHVPADEVYVVAWYFTGTSCFFRVNGAAAGTEQAINTAALSVIDRFALGTYTSGGSGTTFDSSIAFDGAVGEVGILDGVDFSSQAFLDAEAYLMDKWLP
jgi:hypothetical protein